MVNGFRNTGIYPLNKNAINESDLNMAIPWTDEGYQERFSEELKKVSENNEPFLSHCMQSIQTIINPPVTTQIRRVISKIHNAL